MKAQVVAKQVKGGVRVVFQLARAAKLPVSERILREWVKCGEVTGYLSGKDLYLSADEKLTKRLEVWRESMNEMVAARAGAYAKEKARAGVRAK